MSLAGRSGSASGPGASLVGLRAPNGPFPQHIAVIGVHSGSAARLARPTRPPRSRRAPWTTCSTISAVERLRVSPAWPVAQNGQFIPHPAWLEMHMVTRPG